MALCSIRTWAANGSITLIAACLFSCVDSLPNAPSDSDSPIESLVISAAPTPVHQAGWGTIHLAGMLEVPGLPFITHASINGQVSYSLVSMPYRGALRINLNLSMVATIIPEGGETTRWLASGKSLDKLFLLQGGSVLLEKDFIIEGSQNPMNLSLLLTVTPDGVNLKGMWLETAGVGFSESLRLAMQCQELRDD